MNIETKAKELAKLEKKRIRLEKQTEDVRKQIIEAKKDLTETFKTMGLSASFSPLPSPDTNRIMFTPTSSTSGTYSSDTYF